NLRSERHQPRARKGTRRRQEHVSKRVAIPLPLAVAAPLEPEILMVRRFRQTIYMCEADAIQRHRDERRARAAADAGGRLIDGLRLVGQLEARTRIVEHDRFEDQHSATYALHVTQRRNRILKVVQQTKTVNQIEATERGEIVRLDVGKNDVDVGVATAEL